jgi:hypothetical protein
MEKGNEGDEIILFAFRQIDCPIPPTINSVSQLSVDLIIEVIVKSLYLITDGEVKFPSRF